MLDQRLRKVFQEVFGRADLEVEEETTAADVPEWDSLRHIQLIVAVEKEFGVKFKNSEIARLKNVGDLQALVAKRQGG